MSLKKKFYNPSDPKDAEELLNYIEALDDQDRESEQIEKSSELQFILVPPTDGADSDLDDAPSDNEEVCDIRDLGKGVLKQNIEVICVSNEGEKEEMRIGENVKEKEFESSDDDIPLAQLVPDEGKTPKKNKKTNWVVKSFSQRKEKLKINKNVEPELTEKIRNENLQPIDIFKMFFSEEFMQFVCNETKKYASFKGDHDFSITTDEMYVYFAILILSGYSRVPFRRMMWETKADSFNALVSNSISRNRFETIHRYLHFNDNLTIDPSNKVYKVQPLIDQVNNISQELFQPLGQSFSLDEAMEPYYGHHSMKQFIKGKPIRYGFKFWCLTTSEGYLLRFSPYCGAGDKQEGKTLGSSVTEKLCLGYLPEGSTVYLDNYFNSLSLLRSLKSQYINCVGTIRADRVEKAPIRDLKKCPRGTSHVIEDRNNGITIVRWHDNNQVTAATNVTDPEICFTKGSCKRWSKKEHSSIQVDQPTLIDIYNQGMGGVDLFDKMRGLYRTRIRSRKWYWPFVRFCLNGALVNMWMLYRYAYPKISNLDFIRRIVLTILTSPPYIAGPKPKCSKNVLEEIKYDSKNHLIDKQETQRRCGHCGKCTKFHCIKCNVGLHPDACFRLYHTP